MNNFRGPNLIIPGFPKSGTSSLFDYLVQHPEIYKSVIKEPHTYSHDTKYENRFFDNGIFNRLYPSVKEKYIIDASTSYMISKVALSRLIRDNPSAKIIIIARDPIERIFSHYNWIRTFGIPTKPFQDELLYWCKKDFEITKPMKGNFKNYIEFSKYGEQIERYLNVFPKRNILIIPSYELKDNYKQTLKNIVNFLNIEEIDFNEVTSNKTSSRVFLEKNYPNIYKMLIKKINKLTNKKLSIDKHLFEKDPLKKVVFDENDEKFVYNLIADDLIKLKKLGCFFSGWKTVNKYFH